jgi:two-component system sensor histidine kinase KdpD
VHVIRQETTSKARPRLIDEISYYRSKTGWSKYWYTMGAIATVSLFGRLIEPLISYRSIGFLFLLAVIIVGMFGSIGAVVLAAAMSALVWDYFFIPPKMTFVITNADDFLMCVAFFVVAVITGFLTNRLRFHERMTREREERTNVLYEILQEIANSLDKSEFIKKVTDRVGRLLSATCGAVLKSSDGKLRFDEVTSYSLELAEKDRAVAHWCFENGKVAGWSTDTLPQASALFIPLKGASETVGVFIFQPLKKTRKIDLEKENLLVSVVRQLGVSIERHFLMRRLAEAQRLKDSEELHQTLLNSISHEMRTPLTAILGSAAALENEELTGGNGYVKEVAAGLQEAGDRLNRVIENLLDMSRLNSGVLSLNLDWHDLNDLLNVVGKKLEKTIAKHNFKINFNDSVPLAKIDFRLMEHAISNLLVNAVMYTPEQAEIVVNLQSSEKEFMIEVVDHGPGITPEFLPHIFDKFYRVPGSRPGGTGLGLSIVRSIVELHHGRISVGQVNPHGTIFKIILPVQTQPPMPAEGT